jgi:DNA helicase II / ATP-dependent DNA helicase PcrA
MSPTLSTKIHNHHSEKESDVLNHTSDNDLLNLQHTQVIQQEEGSLKLVMKAISNEFQQRSSQESLDQELLALREQIQEARLEDQASLLEHMTRLAALRNSQLNREDEQNDDEFVSAPYFGRICYQEEDDDGQAIGKAKQVFVGKKSFFSKDGHVKIVDWRSSPMSQLYYRMREGEYFYETLGARELGGTVTMRRTLSVKEGELWRIQYGENSDQVLVKKSDTHWYPEYKQNRKTLIHTAIDQLGGGSMYLKDKNSNVYLPEITALIDAEQFDLITHEQSGVVIIQGGAGTGKTTIALHRVAYLMYQNPKRFKGEKILILTPGKALQRYIAHVLPALNVEYIPIHRIDQWAFEQVKRVDPTLKSFTLIDHTPFAAQKIKRNIACIRLIEKVIQKLTFSYERELNSLAIPQLMQAWVQRRTLPLQQRLIKLKIWVKDQRLAQGGEIIRCLDRCIQRLPKAYDLWVELFSDSLQLSQYFEDLHISFTPREIQRLVDSVSEQSKTKISYKHLDQEYQMGVDGKSIDSEQGLRQCLDTEDCMIILRCTQLINGLPAKSRTGKVLRYEHIMVDEAQDLSPVALQVLCACTTANSPITLAGDTAQRIVFNNGFNHWQEMIPYLPKKTMILPPLTVSYRSTFEIMGLARYVLGDLKHDWSTRDIKHGKAVAYMHFTQLADQVVFVADALKALVLDETQATVAVVAPNAQIAEMYFKHLQRANCQKIRLIQDQNFPFNAGIDVCYALQVKGLEYDYVIALDVNQQYYPIKKQARHLLHVVATRAAYQLWCLTYGQSTPSELLPKSLIDTGSFSSQNEDLID